MLNKANLIAAIASLDGLIDGEHDDLAKVLGPIRDMLDGFRVNPTIEVDQAELDARSVLDVVNVRVVDSHRPNKHDLFGVTLTQTNGQRRPVLNMSRDNHEGHTTRRSITGTLHLWHNTPRSLFQIDDDLLPATDEAIIEAAEADAAAKGDNIDDIRPSERFVS